MEEKSEAVQEFVAALYCGHLCRIGLESVRSGKPDSDG
jgi:hypothetical protein